MINKIFLSAVIIAGSFTGRLCAQKTVALTIDDGPRPVVTEKIIDILNKYNVTATFFMVGLMVEKYPHLARRVFSEGFEIGNHTYSDTRLTSMSPKQIQEALTSFEDILEDAIGQRTSYFRPPGGRYNQAVLDISRQEGLNIVLWSKNVNDTAPGITPERILDLATRNPQKSEVILMHDGPQATLDALPDIIEFYKSRDYKFVTVSSLTPPLFKDTKVASIAGHQFNPLLFLPPPEESRQEGSFPKDIPGAIILFAGAGSILFLIKIKKGGLRPGKISVVFLGGQHHKIEMITDVLDKKGVSGAFFVTAEEMQKFSKNLRAKFLEGSHQIAYRKDSSKEGAAVKDINRWLNAAGDLKQMIMPFWYSAKEYNKNEIYKLKEIKFFPVNWKIGPPARTMTDPAEITDYVFKKTGKNGVIPLYPENISSKEDLLSILNKLEEAGYRMVSLDEYVLDRHAA
ncbi:MAG: polysaccharide deacetylase family protein [Elusimicrobiota bacterium]|nr:polysaccharide deacetylase family protein [Elusimicrobiota bacterium]